jgi:hypothetical protein
VSERIAQWQRHYVLMRFDDGVGQWGRSRKPPEPQHKKPGR